MTDDTRSIRVLYIEDNPMDASYVAQALAQFQDIKLQQTDSLSDGHDQLQQAVYDVILLDLNLPDAPGGLATFGKARELFPLEIPIVVHTSMADEEIGLGAVKMGAQDYLIKGHSDGVVLANALRFAVEKGAQEGFFRTMVFCSPSAVVVVDWKGVVRFVNKAAEDLFGRSAVNWVGRIFGYDIDQDRPQTVSINSHLMVEFHVTETELGNEILNIIHVKRANLDQSASG